jgi:hypothetical protein
MEFLILLLFATLAAATLLPTIPNSRKTRVLLGIAAIPMVLSVYGFVEKFSSRPGAESVHMIVEISSRLIKEGKSDVLLKAFEKYDSGISELVPHELGAADRARHLYDLLWSQEMLQDRVDSGESTK